MFIYFLEQVWTQGDTDWLGLNWRTREIAKRYWDLWHTRSHKMSTYPTPSMEEGNDWLEW